MRILKYAPLILFLLGNEIASAVAILYLMILFVLKILKERADHADY